MTLLQNINDPNSILIMIYCFVDDFLKGIVSNIKYVLDKPGKNRPPTKKHNLSLAELASLAISDSLLDIRTGKIFIITLKLITNRIFPTCRTIRIF